MLATMQLLHATILYMAQRFFLVHSYGKIDKLKCVVRFTDALMYLFIGLFFGLAIWQMVDFISEPNGICNTLSFVIPSFFDALISVLFVIFGCYVQSVARKHYQEQINNNCEDKLSPRASK